MTRGPHDPGCVETGFTLIELMVAMAVLFIAVGVGWGGLSTARRVGAAELHLLRVTTALESEMDRLRAGIPASEASGPFDDPELRWVPGAAARRELTRVAPGLLRVQLTVTWRTDTGRPRQAALVSLVRRDPIKEARR